MKHNPMSINRGLCSLKKKKHKKLCGRSLELLSVEFNILVVSWGQICDNSLATKVLGANIVHGKRYSTSKLSYFCLSFVLTLFFHYYFV